MIGQLCLVPFSYYLFILGFKDFSYMQQFVIFMPLKFLYTLDYICNNPILNIFGINLNRHLRLFLSYFAILFNF
jgi:hypothetical protein